MSSRAGEKRRHAITTKDAPQWWPSGTCLCFGPLHPKACRCRPSIPAGSGASGCLHQPIKPSSEMNSRTRTLPRSSSGAKAGHPSSHYQATLTGESPPWKVPNLQSTWALAWSNTRHRSRTCWFVGYGPMLSVSLAGVQESILENVSVWFGNWNLRMLRRGMLSMV